MNHPLAGFLYGVGPADPVALAAAATMLALAAVLATLLPVRRATQVDPVIALGSPGGPNIIGYVTQALVEMIDWGRSPGAAAAAPHILNRNGPTLVEAGTSALDLRDALEALGHDVEERNLKSGLNIVQFKDGAMIGASDPRRDGIALGE